MTEEERGEGIDGGVASGGGRQGGEEGEGGRSGRSSMWNSRSFKRVDEANAIAGMKEAGSTEGEDSEGREDSWHFRLIPQVPCRYPQALSSYAIQVPS